MDFLKKLTPGAAILATCFVSGSAGAALYGFGPAESWTIAQITKLSTAISSQIGTFGTTFGANMAVKFEQAISAVAVATKQESLGASIVSDASRDSAAQLVNAVRAQRSSDQIASAMLDFNPATGQGHEPCLTTAKNRTLDAAFDALGRVAKANVAALDLAPGRMVSSVGAAMTQRLATHRDKFCTQGEASAGLCSLSSLPGGDTNASLLFEPTDPGSLQQQAQQAFTQHVLGAPDAMIAKEAGQTPAGQHYMLTKNSKDALLSIPAYSMSMIQAANTRSPDLANKSPNEVLKLRVNQYFGGKEAQDWSKTLTAQSERGLMVEAAKLGGLEVWLHHKQYQQNQRLEMNLAALVLAQSEEAKRNVSTRYDRMARDTASSAIR
ncbi:hypothetical protein RCH14_004542 [Massilia sp. MP_M2]|uniref:hypothetical protein n=1 Tax=Massilia sp. MP_M2 TaxID=3071713 RepID=UPI00319E94FA